MRRDEIIIHQAFERPLRVRHPTDLVIDADEDAAKAVGCGVAWMDEDAIKPRNGAEPWYLASIRLGPGAAAELGADAVHVYDVCPHRDSCLAVDLGLFYLLQRIMTLEPSVLVLYGVADIGSVDVQPSYGVRLSLGNALQ